MISQELPAGTQEPAQGKHAEEAGLQLYLHVDQQLPQVARRHHDGGVELDDVALVQSYVMIRCQTLHAKHRNDTTEPSAMTVKRLRRGNSGKTGHCVKQTSLPRKQSRLERPREGLGQEDRSGIDDVTTVAAPGHELLYPAQPHVCPHRPRSSLLAGNHG